MVKGSAMSPCNDLELTTASPRFREALSRGFLHVSLLGAESLLTTKSMELKAGTFDCNVGMHPSARFNPSVGTRERMPKRHG